MTDPEFEALPDNEKVGRLLAVNERLIGDLEELRRRLGPTLEPKAPGTPWVRQSDIQQLFREGRGPEVYEAARNGRILPTLAAPDLEDETRPGLRRVGTDIFEMTTPPAPRPKGPR